MKAWTLIKIAFVVILALWGYNYFFGTDTEKEQAKTVAQDVGKGVTSLKDFIIANKDKADPKKIQEGIDKASSILKDIGAKANELDTKYKTRIADLEQKRTEIEASIKKIDQTAKDAKAKKDAAQAQLDKLVGDIDHLTSDMKDGK
ncbi:MAG: hypothetical protein RI894_2450 [Bacteroidota bacterium]|jgi:uncharacterized coiled-coil protein SlyX